MPNIRNFVSVAMVLGVMGFWVADASAQVIGTFRWRYEPFCNVVTLTIIQQGPPFQEWGAMTIAAWRTHRRPTPRCS